MTGYVVLGLGFGILLSTKGYNFAWALLTSLGLGYIDKGGKNEILLTH